MRFFNDSEGAVEQVRLIRLSDSCSPPENGCQCHHYQRVTARHRKSISCFQSGRHQTCLSTGVTWLHIWVSLCPHTFRERMRRRARERERSILLATGTSDQKLLNLSRAFSTPEICAAQMSWHCPCVWGRKASESARASCPSRPSPA